jgi:DNA end-binding protein Ku
MLGITLRYPYEIRKEADYFDEIPDEKIPRDMLDLAVHIVETKAGHFEPERFTDHYEDALKELIKKKQRGEKIERPKKHPQAQVINLMEAPRPNVAAPAVTRGAPHPNPCQPAEHAPRQGGLITVRGFAAQSFRARALPPGARAPCGH